ncbi:MAG: heme-binding domain-containing protein [Phaeodactylibacter sp.]|nr:heme-binding domain-containing protein [Phaeodactylibacter sp.]MCB9273617.1 heme-binding domain-containing protein [Lewinellaceae bacterium]
MKHLRFYLILLPALLILQPSGMGGDAPAAAGIKFPKKVNAIIQNKCYGCHSNEGQSDKVKAKLNWDLLPTMSASEQSEKLGHIMEVLEKGKMPPARFLEKEPGMKLTDAETAKLKKWAKKTAKKVSK